MGWEALKNGELLTAAGSKFDVVITVDSKLKHQQNLAALRIAVVVMIAPTNRYADLAPLAPKVLAALTTLTPNTLIEVRLP
jgi:hypothetical protein